MEKVSLSVLVPAYNEELMIGESLKRLLVLGDSPHLSKVQVIIVNDASTDDTRQEIEKFLHEMKDKYHHFDWIHLDHEHNLGKGKAVQTALAHATGEISIIHDADLEYYPKDILKMLPLFIEERADAVFGSRFAASEFRRVLMFRHELGNRLITFLCNLVSNLNLTDIETCYKAVRTRLLVSIPLESNDFRIEAELTIKLAKRKAKIFEVPINYSGRSYQEGKKIRWKDGVRAIGAIIRFGWSDHIFKGDPLESKMLMGLSRAKKFNHWMADTIRPFIGRDILEIGSGIGNITQELMAGKHYYASDINSFYLEMIDKFRLHNPRLDTVFLDVKDVSPDSRPTGRFDTVICLNVIEHLDNDRQAMKNISALLKDGGKAIILVPRGKWLYGSQDEVLGHKRRYTDAMIRELEGEGGLQLAELIGFNKSSVLPWFINGRMFRKRTFSRVQIGILDAFIPLIKRIDNYLPWPPLSLIAVFEKRRGNKDFAKSTP